MVVTALGSCAHSASTSVASPPTAVPAAPYTVEWAAPADGIAGACDAREYTASAERAAEFVFDVVVGDDGRAAHLAVTRSTGDDAKLAFATDVVRHLFRCRHVLAAGAPRLVTGYRFRFAPVTHLPFVDSTACGRAARYPAAAEEAGRIARVRAGVGLDEEGHVTVVWVDGAGGNGFAEAAVGALAHRCPFGAARVGAERVAFFLIYTFEFAFR